MTSTSFHITQCFWHSSAHVLGQALELELGADLTIGPALEEGFYYDCYLEERTLTEGDKPRIEGRIKEVRTWGVAPCFSDVGLDGCQCMYRVVPSTNHAC